MVVDSSVPGQFQGTTATWSSREVTPVCDPEMPPSFRSWAIRQSPTFKSQGNIAVLVPGGSSGGARPTAVGCWLLAAVAMVLVFLDPLSTGPGGWLAAAAVLAVTAGTLQHRASRRDRRLCRSKVIFPASLDETSRELLGRGQRAIGTVLGSEVRAAGLLANPVHDGLLRQHEWEIAGQLSEITKFRSLLAENTLGSSAGPMTKDVLKSHQRAIELAQAATVARVVALERYAEQVSAADEADRDWQQAVKLSKFNDEYLDLVARAASDEYAVGEIADLGEKLRTVAEARRDRLHEADLTACVLTWPATAIDMPREAGTA
jgi:hypothetical protein